MKSRQDHRVSQFEDGGVSAGRRRHAVTLIALTLAALAAVLTASPALAVRTHPFEKAVTLPEFAPTPMAIAINQATHHVYVAARTPNGRAGTVYNYGPDGILDPNHPTLPSGDFINYPPFGIAVDNSDTATAGYIYVVQLGEPPNLGKDRVLQYDADGVATGTVIDDASIPPNGTPQAGGLPNVVNDGSFYPRNAIAVGPDGHLFAGEFRPDAGLGLIDEFTSTGTFVAQYPYGKKIGVLSVASLAIGPAGEFYALGKGGLKRLGPNGECLDGSHLEGSEELCDPFVAPEPGRGFREVFSATDSGRFLVFDGPATEGGDTRLFEYDETGQLMSRIGAEQIKPSYGTGGAVLDEETDKVYVLVEQPDIGLRELLIFGATVITPDAVTNATSNASDSGVTFHGEVGADGGLDATCLFQYVDEAEFKANGGFSGARTAACDTGPFTDEALTAVQAEAEDLNGGTRYHQRIVASNANGSTPGADIPFTTPGPTVSGGAATGITTSEADLSGEIDPNGVATSYVFQYVTDEQFAADGYAQAVSVPAGGEAIGEGTEAVAVAQHLSGLAPGTGYHFRILATDSEGNESRGDDHQFATYTPPFSGLPDGRVYEQASPTDKNGASLQGEPNAVMAAPDGSGITFFSGLGIPGGEGAQTFPSYLASRASDGSGWSTIGLLPPASSGPYGRILGWSDDLSAVYSANRQVGSPETLYVREGSGPLHGVAEGEGDPGAGLFSFAASSAGGDEVLFEGTGVELAEGAAADETNAYLWDSGTDTIHLAGVLNDGEAPSEGSFAGTYDWFGTRDTSVSAAAGLYHLQDAHAISEDGSRLFFTAAGSGRLYMRVNPTAAQSPLDGGGDCTDPSLGCTIWISKSQRATSDPGGEQPAAFLGATADGSRAFFASTERLTDDATGGFPGSGGDLYRYEGGALTDMTPGAGPQGAGVQGLLGMSEDGSYVYFAANGVLAPGAQPGNCKPDKREGECSVYLAHAGTIQFVARLRAQAPGLGSDLLNWAPTAFGFEGNSLQEHTARVSADGQTLLLQSRAKLTSYDSEGTTQLYLYAAGGGLSCISCNPTGLAPAGDAGLQSFPLKLVGPRLPFAIQTRNLSSDGKRIFFDTPDRLVASDANGVRDVYEWEAAGKGSCESDALNGCLYLISTGASTAEPSYFGDADETGDNAFFFTASRLVGQDKDELVDVYDARVGGGIASQNRPTPVPCEAEGCLPAAPTAPESMPAGSAILVGPGNPKPKAAQKCRKGKVRRKGRCVKRHPHKHKGKEHKKRSGRQGGELGR